MFHTPDMSATGWAAAAAPNPWRPTLDFLISCLRQWLWAVVACGFLGGVVGVGVKAWLPTSYSSTAQLLFDPRGFKIFNNELTSGNYDANAAVNFVESQMAVLLSERVLTRVVDSECAAAIIDSGEEGASAATRAPTFGFVRFCPGVSAAGEWAKAMLVLQKALTVKRAERSFVVDLTATGVTPELAAKLATRVVEAYLAEDAATRAAAAAKLNAELGGRVDEMRATLVQSEAKVEAYRRDKSLVRVGDRLLVEQKLGSATTSMNDAQGKLDRLRARVKQLETAPNSISALGALGAEADTRNLAALLERKHAVMMEIAPLQSRLGARHPLMIEARGRLAEVERGIALEMQTIRGAARADLERVRSELAGHNQTVKALAGEAAHSHQAEIELRTLERTVEANRKLLESFENRSREAGEFVKVDSANLRIVSVARPPETQRLLPKLLAWGMIGFVVGVMLATAAISGVAFLSVFARMRLANQPSSPRPFGAPEPHAEAAPAYATRRDGAARGRYG